MAMSNRERQAKWRARARAAIRGGDEYTNLVSEQVEMRAKRWRGRHDLAEMAKGIEQFYLSCVARQRFLAEELIKDWDEERAHDLSQVQRASEEALIDFTAVQNAMKSEN